MNFRWKIAQAAEIRWWQMYLKGKDTQKYLSWKYEYWQSFLNKIKIKEVLSGRCIDVGCGPAGIFMTLKADEVHALDPLIDDYEIKLKHFKKENYPDVVFHPVALEDFSTSMLFDYVFCINAINHVADLKKCFQQLSAMTKKGGQLILSIDAHNHTILKHIFSLLPGDVLHPHQYDLKEYKEMLVGAGFEQIEDFCIEKQFIFNYYVLKAVKK